MNEFRVAQKVFVTNEKGELLVVRMAPHEPEELRERWDFPGGGMEYGEDMHEALLREVREELGPTVKLNIGKAIVIWDFIVVDSKKHCVAIGYDAQWLSGTIELNDEHDEYQWIHPDNLHTLKWPVQHTSAVEKYMEARRAL